MERVELVKEISGGLFISSMMGVTDGPWVTERAAGTRMVQIGALIADLSDRSHDAKYLLPKEQDGMVPILKRQVNPIREKWGNLPICLNAAPGDLQSAVCMAQSFERAGGDIFELNCHGGYARLLERGLLRNMVRQENRSTMRAWLIELCRLSIPVVVKFNGTMEDIDFCQVLDEIADVEDLFGVHFNVRDDSHNAPDIDLVRRVRPHVKGLLLCSGHVRSPENVTELQAAGADCVGISQGLRDEPGIFKRLTEKP